MMCRIVMKFPASFKQSLALHFVVVAVLPILLLGLLSIHYFKQKHLEATFKLLDAHDLDVSRNVTDFLQHTSASLTLLEKTLNSGLLRNDAEINQYLQMAVNEQKNFESIYLLDNQQRITHLGLPEGRNNNLQDYLGLDLSAHEVFTGQAQLSGYTWSDTFLSAITAEPSIGLGIPIRNGTLLGTVSLKTLSAELVARLEHIGGDFQFSLLDHRGDLIADSRPGLTSQLQNLRLPPEVRKALDDNVEVTGRFHEDSGLLESARLIPETGWVAYVSLSAQEAMQGVTHLRYLLINTLAAAIGLGFILALCLSRRMLRSILLLRNAVRAVAKGDYDLALQPARYKELEDLSGSFRDMISFIKEREQSILESEARFRSLFQTHPDAVLITNVSEGRIVSVNDAGLSIFGYTREEVIGKTTLDAGIWVDVTERDHYLELVREQGYVENIELTLRCKDDSILIGLASARILEQNNESFLLSVVRNITQMKEAEARLVRSEARFRSLISAMGEGLIIIGYNGEVVQCNHAAEKILKMNADNIIGKFNDEIIANAVQEDGSLFDPNMFPSAITLQTGKPVNNQLVGLPLVAGENIWLQVNSHALSFDRAGKPIAVVVSFADVTRLKRIEADLRESEQRMQLLSRQFQGVLEAIPDRIMILDPDMRVIWLNWFEDDSNHAGEKLLENLCCYELPWVHCGPSSSVDSPLCDNCPVHKSLVTGRVESAQVELSDGRTLSLRAFPVFNELGEVVNVIEIAQNVTESLRRQAQSMRTGQLAALGELAAGVAHEINNPINGVINYAQLILNKALTDSREQELSQRIILESERIATIVRELLYFAREETQEVLKMTVSAALSEALALTQNQLNKQGIQLQLKLPGDLPMIMSRSHQIQRLFLNLISNARHALAEKYPDTNPNKILLVKGDEILKDGQPFVRITFRDHGVGIDAELLSRVMNPFTTTKSSREGAGLGLSVSHEIVQKHGGTMTIDSVYGEFTEVTIELPVEK